MTADDAPILDGQLVRLRPTQPGDAERRAELGRNREISRGFGADLETDEPMSLADAQLELDYRFGPGPHWAIADATDDHFLGVVRLAPLDEAARAARFAIGILDPARLGHGLGTEAAQLAIGHGFGALDLRRIELMVLADNQRAIRSYENVGFRLARRLPQNHRRGDELIDDLIMVVTAEGYSPTP